ncbi:unnamed protein product, partial [Rotaria socialis]
YSYQMDHSNQLTSPRTPVHITDEEHTLILMLRTMPLDEIIYVMMLNNFLPIELPRKYDHIANIINLHFKKSYEVHKKFITVESIKNDQFIYLNGNQVFDQNLLIDFEQQLIQNNVSFEGYTSAYNSKIQLIEKRQNQKSTTATDSITLLDERYFQMTWLLINVVKFLFMTTNQKVSNIPMSVRDVDECNDYFSKIQLELYKNFVGFWTQHQRFTKRCNPTTCSKVFIVDGHQKANRLVCQYKDVFDNSIYELGPVQMGCLHSPLRKARNVDHRYCQLHQPKIVTSVNDESIPIHQIVLENKETTLDKLALMEYVDKDGHYDDALCNVFRSGINSKLKISSYGFLATFLSCSVIVGFTEQPCSEGSACENFIPNLINI